MDNSHKNRSKLNKKIFLLVILLIFIIIGIVIKFYGYDFVPVYQYSKQSKEQLPKQQDIFSSYDVSYKTLGDLHYVFIEDLYSQGQAIPLKDRTTIFRMDIAIQTIDKRSAETITDNIETIISTVRNNMRYLEASDISEIILSQNIKRDINDRIRSKIGEGYIVGIYFEEFIGQ